jgi:hypothetical protein
MTTLRAFSTHECSEELLYLPDAERSVLNRALEKYRLGQSEPILVGGKNQLNRRCG